MLVASTESFILDSRLQADTLFVADLPLCRIMLMNDQRYDWLLAVPRIPDVTEWVQLSAVEQQQLLLESRLLSQLLIDQGRGDKLNVGALGNVVAQLHIHHLMRHPQDPAWPGPVWGHSPAQPYSDTAASAAVQAWQQRLRDSAQLGVELIEDL